jgi:LysM repeat protein
MPKFRRSRALLVGSVLVSLVAAFSVDYTVESGDTLGKIAREQGVSLSDLIAANGISNPNQIFPGQVLVIPGSDEIYVVAAGDTLGRIASKHGTSVTAIAQANNISNTNLIRVGQQLVISSSGSGSGPEEGDGSDGGEDISDRSGNKHIVRKGETVAQIAALYTGVTVEDIVSANGIINGVIYTGTALYLGGPGYVASGTSGETSYTVGRGDRLSDIAHAFGVSLSTLTSTNGISDANLIRTGQILTVPTGTSWTCPVEAAAYFNDWGFPRGGGTRYHEGNDLFVTKGAPVRAPVSGTVRHITGTIGGKQFSLDGADDIRYIGTHMDAFGKEGQVAAGDIIGYVGNSGNALGTRPHLHFGMYYEGTPVNPYPTLVSHGC